MFPRRAFLPFNISSINALRFVWLLLILYHELFLFPISLRSCTWPSPPHALPNAAPTPASRVLLLADPQILDLQSYPDRHWTLQYLSQWIVDLNMRKSWWAARRLEPDVVLVLGDMMDRGRADISDDAYEAYYRRFKNMFTMPEQTPVYYIPGNHDVGLGTTAKFSPTAIERYKSHFGALNQALTLANHTLVLIDAPGLVDEDARRARSRVPLAEWHPDHGGAYDFVKQTFGPGQRRDAPNILLTHIPLARPPNSPCGPLRERGTIRAGAGRGYQNTLGSVPSEFLMDALKPVAVFSGDDHDYCEYSHGTASDGGEEAGVHEVTVKSFSMAMGIRRPGFQLLSLFPASEGVSTTSPRHADTPCQLPDQLGVYLGVYVPAGALSLLFLMFTTWRGTRGHAPAGAGTASAETMAMNLRSRSDSLSSSSSPDGTLLPGPGGRRQVAEAGRSRWPWIRARKAADRGFAETEWVGGRRRKDTFVRRFAGQLWEAAWPALGTFGSVTLWAFW